MTLNRSCTRQISISGRGLIAPGVISSRLIGTIKWDARGTDGKKFRFTWRAMAGGKREAFWNRRGRRDEGPARESSRECIKRHGNWVKRRASRRFRNGYSKLAFTGLRFSQHQWRYLSPSAVTRVRVRIITTYTRLYSPEITIVPVSGCNALLWIGHSDVSLVVGKPAVSLFRLKCSFVLSTFTTDGSMRGLDLETWLRRFCSDNEFGLIENFPTFLKFLVKL